MQIGDIRTEAPSFWTIFGHGAGEPRQCRVVYVHPQRRFYTVEFYFPMTGERFLESYYFDYRRRCDRACAACSGSKWDPETKKPRFEPIPGWTAQEVVLQDRQTYHITACPRFKHDPLGRTEAQDGTDLERNTARTFY